MLFLLSLGSCQAVFIGNPSSPVLQQGLLVEGDYFFLRAGLEIDYLWKLQCQDLQKEPSFSNLNMLNCLGVVSATFFSRLEFSGLIGTSTINLNHEMVPDGTFSFGAGGKLLLFKGTYFDMALSGTYFRTTPELSCLLVNGEKMPLLNTSLTLDYEEIQGCFAISYKQQHYFIPYIGVTYLDIHLSPSVLKGLIEHPEFGPCDFLTSHLISSHEWGAVGGASLLAKPFILFTIEGRFFNQYAISGRLEIRF